MAEADATTTELEAIRAVVSTIEWTQRAELVDEFMDLFAANAIWTTSGGVRASSAASRYASSLSAFCRGLCLSCKGRGTRSAM